MIADELDISSSKIVSNKHHVSHAASAFFASPFDDATVVTIDGVGEYETTTVSIGSGNSLKKVWSCELPNSIGLFYSAFTAYLGFRVNEGEYKVMGMAAFGTPRYLADIEQLLRLEDDGSFNIDPAFFAFHGMGDLPYTPRLCDRFGVPRQVGAPFATDEHLVPPDLPAADVDRLIGESQRFADIAASVQLHTERAIRHVVDHAVAKTGISNVALAGGVALNSLANGRLARESDYSLFIQPAAGDAGCALGAALYHWHQHSDKRGRAQQSCSLGRSFPADRSKAAAAGSGYRIIREGEVDQEYLRKVASLISDGAVVGWFHGRSEWGPRALGNRSILADPRNADNKRIVNEKVKFREPFRPFAPAVMAERAGDFFELPGDAEPWIGMPETFMLSVHPVRESVRHRLPATTHADGTARVQLVFRQSNDVFYDLLREYEVCAGVPIVLNTSFNLNGEPIVDTPEDAIRTFSLSGLDYLCLDGIILSKELSEAI